MRHPPAATGFRVWLRVAFLVYAVGVFAYRDALMDDTFIHLQYARNLRAQGELAFNAGEPSMGATSPLWVLLLSLLGATPAAARLASVGFGALSVWLFALQARRLGGGAFAAAASIAWAGNLWLVRHAPNGMESTAAVCCVLLAVQLHQRPPGPGRHLGLGLAAAAACLLRPELALLVACLAAADLGRLRARAGWLWLGVFLVPVAAWSLFAWTQTGAVLPGTAGAKSAGPGAQAAFVVLLREARILGVAHPVECIGLGAALLLQLRLQGVASLRRLRSHPWLPFGGFAVSLLAAYAILDVQVQPRYLLPALPLLTLAGFAAWRALWGGSVRAAAGLATAALLVSLVASAVRVLPATRDYGRGLLPSLLPLVEEMRARVDAAGGVATPDIGVIGYYADRRVVDLGGLIDPRLQALRRTLGADSLLVSGAFLEAAPVAFVVDRHTRPQRFAGMTTAGRRWTPVRTTVMPNLGITRPGPIYYTLYALEP